MRRVSEGNLVLLNTEGGSMFSDQPAISTGGHGEHAFVS